MIRLGQRPKMILKNYTAPSVRKPWRRIVEDELARHGCSYREASSKSRMPHIVRARWTIYRRLTDERGATSYRMRELFGQDHTTILNALGRLSGKGRAVRDNAPA